MQQQTYIVQGDTKVNVTGITFPEAFAKVQEAGIKAGKTSVRTVFTGQGEAMGMKLVVEKLKTARAPKASANTLENAFNRAVTSGAVPHTTKVETSATGFDIPTPSDCTLHPEPQTVVAKRPKKAVEPKVTTPAPEATKAQDKPAAKAKVATPPAPVVAAVAPDYAWDEAWMAMASGAGLPAIHCIGGE